MKNIDVEQLKSDMKNNSYHKIRNFVTKEEIEQIKVERDKLLKIYSDEMVRNRLCYKREDSKNRQGDAIMVALEKNDFLPNFYFLNNDNVLLRDLLEANNLCISVLTGKQVAKDSRSMFNSQQYFEHSLPVFDHYDGEFFDFEHSLDDSGAKIDGYSLQVTRGLIPRYVMVIVLENENNGVGTYVRLHNSDERIPLENNAGDLIIFDNLAVRHGVPELEHPRSMVGFRNFDHLPYYFEANPEGGNDWIELVDKINPGWVRAINNQEALGLMIEFNKEWYNSKYFEYCEKRPAF